MIYRVEDSEGKGPYYANLGGYAVKSCGGGPRHPEPRTEGWHGRHGSAEVFGFAGKEQLEAWFSWYDLEALRALGYMVNTYDIEPHWASETQCTFFK